MQERAARTRQALIHAAALEFDQIGYAAASLAGIGRAAGTSTGAVTFHFTTKAALADAVHAHGVAATRHAMEQVDHRAGPLRTAIAMAGAVVRCLENDVTVRAAARLDQDRDAYAHRWSATWSTAVQDELAGAPGPPPGAPTGPSLVLALLVYLVHGAEVTVRAQHREHAPAARAGSVSELFTRMWETLLPSVEWPPQA
ncbi:TetR family transcriptional regulator [Streptomyces sp. NPDC048361]|uniref:TetR family transcriptional regulator n=1 Tax=Streptomyces sp. NPDC048361 TaxID=3154720 RepID=UPI003436B5DA